MLCRIARLSTIFAEKAVIRLQSKNSQGRTAELRSLQALVVDRAGRCRDGFAPGTSKWGDCWKKDEEVVGSRNELRGSRFEGTGSNTGSKLETDLTILDGGQKLTSVARTLFDDSRPKGAAAGEGK